VDSVKEIVVASWSGNPPKTLRKNQYSKWRKSKSMTVCSALGSARLATRDEIAASKLTMKG